MVSSWVSCVRFTYNMSNTYVMYIITLVPFIFHVVPQLFIVIIRWFQFVVFFTGQIVPYRYSPVRYFEPAPIQLGQSNVLHELKWVFFFKNCHFFIPQNFFKPPGTFVFKYPYPLSWEYPLPRTPLSLGTPYPRVVSWSTLSPLPGVPSPEKPPLTRNSFPQG